MSNYKILVVEDELLVAADIMESLEILGYTVIDSVATGRKAIESVSRQLPDIILMDIMLKGDMTGIEAATIIRQNHDVPIVYLTANADLSTIEKAKVSLPYGYIIKPFTEKDLQTNIEIARFKFANDIKAKIESDQYNEFFNVGKDQDDKAVFVDTDKGLGKINMDDIYFVSNGEGALTVHLLDEEVKLAKTLSEMEDILPREKFIRVNEQHIVNVDKIFLSKFPEIIISDKMNVILVDEDKQSLLESKLKIA